ncbi:ABC transporter permease [Wenjunlia tyrosinilytica]|uniref:ABC transporter permease n=1 Tax=Wenjunlia tyrosinilytica TaxID=1544741 RepID=A0A917ZVR7_9ACTN|nr:ABC transporter permease [Wenjunlia tyrosinilytica]GGO94767.1 ABC transporter permease [Wenjunlia tyrosinilytica]
MAQDVVSEAEVPAARTVGTLRRLSAGFGTEAQVFVVLAVLLLVFAVAYPSSFATAGNVVNVGRQAGILLVVAVAQMFALVVGGFDLSVAANMAFASTVSALAMTHHHGVVVSAALGVASGAVVGLVNGIAISGFGVSPFVVTLGMLTFLGGFANQLAGGASIAGLPPSFIEYWGSGSWGVIPSAVGIAAVVMVLAWLVLSRLRIGLYIFAVGGGREACRLAGIRVVGVEIAAYTMCGTLAALAGLMLSARVGIGQAGLGQGYDLLSIAAAVIGGVAIGGGTGRLSGVLLGVVFFSVLTTGLNIAAVTEFAQQMIIGVVLVATVLLARTGSLTQRLLPLVHLLTARRHRPGDPA